MISAISLAVVFYFADVGEMIRAMSQANYLIVAAATGISLLWLLVRAIAWRTLLQEKASFSQVFFTLNEGYLLNNILPFRLGEVGRAFLLGQKANLGFWQVFSTILIERALDLALAAGLLFSTLPFVVGATWARQAAVAAAIVVMAGLGGLYLLARHRIWAIAQFNRLAGHWPVLQKLGGGRLTAFFNGLAILTDTGRFLRAVSWMVVDWGIAIFQYYVLLLAFFPQGKLLWAAFSLGVGALGIAAPSSPGALGVLEASLVGALSLFGLDSSTALVFALTAHLLNYLTTGVLGAYALARDGETLSGVYQRIRKIPQPDI